MKTAVKNQFELIGQKFFVIKELTAREIKRKYARSYLGIVWSLLSPLLHMIVMSFIFSYMWARAIENYPVYYLTGSIIWTFFSHSTSHALGGLIDNKTLLLKVKLDRNTFVLSRVFTELVNLGLSMIPYIGILIFFRIKVSYTAIVFIPDIILVLMFAIGVSYFLSVLCVYFADIKHLYNIFTTLWFYCCAIFYPLSKVPELMQTIIGYNPLYLAIYIAREGIMYSRWPHYSAWLKLGIAAVAMFVAGSYFFKKQQNNIMQIL